jgi:hypothetical protein
MNQAKTLKQSFSNRLKQQSQAKRKKSEKKGNKNISLLLGKKFCVRKNHLRTSAGTV